MPPQQSPDPNKPLPPLQPLLESPDHHLIDGAARPARPSVYLLQELISLIRQSFHDTGSKGLYPYELYRIERSKGHRASYNKVRKWIHTLKKMGMIQFVASEQGVFEDALPRRCYRIAPGKRVAVMWRSYPLHLLYPQSKLGSARYIPLRYRQ